MTRPLSDYRSRRVVRPEHLYWPHPGEVFARRFISSSHLNHSQIAERIGINDEHLSRFLSGSMPLDITLARRLEACTNISARAWLHYQTQFDLSQVPRLKSVEPLTNSN